MFHGYLRFPICHSDDQLAGQYDCRAHTCCAPVAVEAQTRPRCVASKVLGAAFCGPFFCVPSMFDHLEVQVLYLTRWR